MVVIIDYGMGNLNSILNMFKKIRVQAIISLDLAVIGDAEKLVLPGVGAFGSGMRKLREIGVIPTLEEKVLRHKTPILGICLGMQLFTKTSEEGGVPGLGWIDAKTEKFEWENENEKFCGVQGHLRVRYLVLYKSTMVAGA